MPLITLDQAPLKNARPPSSFRIFLQQSIVPLYMMSAVEAETSEALLPKWVFDKTNNLG